LGSHADDVDNLRHVPGCAGLDILSACGATLRDATMLAMIGLLSIEGELKNLLLAAALSTYLVLKHRAMKKISIIY
jgi:hypothetical protein